MEQSLSLSLACLCFALLVALSHCASPVYDEQYAKRMVYFSAAAYADSPVTCLSRGEQTPTWRLYKLTNKRCDFLLSTCQAYTAVADSLKQIVVSFRGTTSPGQLLLEGLLDGAKPDGDFFGLGDANRYFRNGLKVLWPDVKAALSDAKLKGYTVTFTGHSLGGAMASLAALQCVHEKLRTSDQVKLYTFGQPRAGDFKLASKHNELVPHSFRVVYRNDLVPHVPPCNAAIKTVFGTDNKPCDPNSTKGTAYHHGTEVWYEKEMPKLETGGDSKQYKVCTGTPKDEDFTCSDKLKFPKTQLAASVSDHVHYFGHQLSAFANNHCDPTAIED